MSFFLWIVFIIVSFISAIPLIRIDLFSVSKKYTYFKYLSMALVAWSTILGLRYGLSDPTTVYYLALIIYPIIFSATSLVFLAIMRFLEKKVPSYIRVLMVVFFIVQVILVFTNASHKLFLNIELTEFITSSAMLYASEGPLFYLNMVIIYLLLIIALVMMVKRLYTSMKEDNDSFPFFFILISIILGMTLNMTHVFYKTFPLDPTYIVFVLITASLYFIFYIRDVRLIIKLANNQFILENLREMYLIVNHKKEVLLASKELQKKFSLPLEENQSFDYFMDKIKKQAIVYSDTEKINHPYDPNKYYIHTQIKKIEIPFYQYHSHMILLYDQTKHQKYIHDMNYIMNHDLMTGLFNRNYFETMRDSLELKDSYAFIQIDLDGLKLFNDHLGHKAGDELLIMFANHLKVLEKENENLIVVRMGGDEFLLIMMNESQKDIDSLIQNIKTASYNEEPLKNIGFSFGYARSSEGPTTAKVLSIADQRMYDMKITRETEKMKLEKLLKEKSIYRQ